MKQKERPIIFSTKMVRAILDGRKTQTRRPIKPQPDPFAIYAILNEDSLSKKPHLWISGYGGDGNTWKNPEFDPWFSCPYQVGDVLWVKETYAISRVGDVEGAPLCEPIVLYKADGYPDDWKSGYIQRPSIFMPKWASRIKLEITGIRVERIQDIPERDCIAEGITPISTPNITGDEPTLREKFADLWDSLWAKKGLGWSQNPWVWVIEFRRIENDTNGNERTLLKTNPTSR